MTKEHKTVKKATESRIEIRRSLFITSVSPIKSAEDGEEFVRQIRKKYSDATHNCYAYITDPNNLVVRFSDDGEPSGTAGQPILGVIKKKKIFFVAVVVTRYFGGIKLGAGGLTSAYTESTSSGLEASEIITMTNCLKVRVLADYSTFSGMYQKLEAAGAKKLVAEYGNNVMAEYAVREEKMDMTREIVESASGGRSTTEIVGSLYLEL